MAEKYEIVLDEFRCGGCGYCIIACARGCLEITGDRTTSRGFTIPTIIEPDKCNGCGLCVMMCPAFAIEIYENVLSEA